MSRFLVRAAHVALTLALIVALGGAPTAAAQSSQATVGTPAPDFTLKDADGEKHSLSEYEGKYVVLEWLNFGCPYVGQHYSSGHMQKLQKKYGKKNVVWLSIVSSAKGKQGYYPPKQMKKQKKKHNGQMAAILMDPSGKVGRMYGARVTPHMYVISPKGTLLYKGGIDDWATANTNSTLPSETYITEKATNYVETSLTQAMNDKEVSPKQAKPYGCTVKYASK
ncbi:MAG: redoxin domain-containing protein [Salinibacter sp.]|uniref:redoxin domain-containing protein n=1 Tax=Salinibacter sp. TaxID=2065818 RepID=UPI0035D461E4